MDNQYLVPANSKKSQLIFGFFTVPDLIICCSGAGITLLLLMIFKDPPMWQLILEIIPLLIGASLVMPVPNYHNVFQLLTNIVTFLFGRRKYYWRGWCVKDEFKD